jgi:hypothetical protein
MKYVCRGCIEERSGKRFSKASATPWSAFKNKGTRLSQISLAHGLSDGNTAGHERQRSQPKEL